MLIGGAILLIAALLIFWPSGESADVRGGKNGKGAGGQQASNSLDGDDAGAVGRARGIAPRDRDPVREREAPRVREGLVAPVTGITAMPAREPEPTSFPTVAAEIAYLERKLVEARENLASRTVFLERMKRIQEQAPISDHQRNSQRAKVVQTNFDKAQDRVDDIQYKLNVLRGKPGAPAPAPR